MCGVGVVKSSGGGHKLLIILFYSYSQDRVSHPPFVQAKFVWCPSVISEERILTPGLWPLDDRPFRKGFS